MDRDRIRRRELVTGGNHRTQGLGRFRPHGPLRRAGPAPGSPDGPAPDAGLGSAYAHLRHGYEHGGRSGNHHPRRLAESRRHGYPHLRRTALSRAQGGRPGIREPFREEGAERRGPYPLRVQPGGPGHRLLYRCRLRCRHHPAHQDLPGISVHPGIHPRP